MRSRSAARPSSSSGTYSPCGRYLSRSNASKRSSGVIGRNCETLALARSSHAVSQSLDAPPLARREKSSPARPGSVVCGNYILGGLPLPVLGLVREVACALARLAALGLEPEVFFLTPPTGVAFFLGAPPSAGGLGGANGLPPTMPPGGGAGRGGRIGPGPGPVEPGAPKGPG